MARLLYQEDSYLREFDATITRVDGNKVFLDQTAFHPGPSGGLDSDTGFLVLPDGTRLEVVDVKEESGDVAHLVKEIKGALVAGMKVHGMINWERRYYMMRLHTASHVLAAVLYSKYGAKITGGMIWADRAQDDFDLQGVQDWRSAILAGVEEANQILKRCLEVKVYWLPRDQALQIPGIVKLAARMPPDVETLRIVEIPGVDIQADGGPHVRNTCEVGQIKVLSIENRGRARKRIYYQVA